MACTTCAPGTGGTLKGGNGLPANQCFDYSTTPPTQVNWSIHCSGFLLPNSGQANSTVSRRKRRLFNLPKNTRYSNFLDLSSFTKPKTIVPVVAAAALLGVVGGYASGKLKLEVLGKYQKPVFIVAGVLLGAFAGKYLAGVMANKQQEASNVPDNTGAEVPNDVSLEIN